MVIQQAFIGVGTVVNVVAVLIGSGLGVVMGERFKHSTRVTTTDALGLMTVVIGGLSIRPLLASPLNEAVPGGAAMVVLLVGLLIGTLLGSFARIEDRIEQFGSWVRQKLGGSSSASGRKRFVDGFVTSTLVFCVGPLAVLGSLSDGLGRGADQLFIKSVLDFFAAMAFAAGLGIGVMVSALAVAVFQGTLTLVGYLLGDVIPPPQVDGLTVVGGVILIGLGIRLLQLKAVRVADMLPALAVAPLLVWLVQLATR